MKCDCLLREELVARFRQAGVPKEYAELTLDQMQADNPQHKEIRNKLKGFCTRLMSGDNLDLVLSGQLPDVKLAGYFLLKAAMLFRSGLCISLDDLTTHFLTQDKRGFNVVREAPVLVLFFGHEYTQQIHQFLLNHLMTFRSEPRFTTIWATSCTKNGLVELYKPAEKGKWLGEVEWVSIPSGWIHTMMRRVEGQARKS